jgi:carbamoylphosphate synthase large subunit
MTMTTVMVRHPRLTHAQARPTSRWHTHPVQSRSRLLSSSMKSAGEVMTIGRTFEDMIQKAIHAIDDQFAGFAKVRSSPPSLLCVCLVLCLA